MRINNVLNLKSNIMEGKDKEPLISVCILNHNGEKRLQKSIPSILSQEYNNLEILFLDNGSTDKSLEYIEQFKEIKIIKNDTNLGTSGGRNKLANYAKGEYIFFIDNDLELTTKSFISDMIKAHIDLENQRIGVIIPIFKMINDDIYCEAGLYYNKIKKTKFKDAYKKGCIKAPGFAATGFLIKKDIFFNLGCFDEKYPYNMDDNDFSMRLYIMGYTIFVNTNLYAIHHGIETRTTAKGIGRRHQYYFCGLMRALLKNYRTKNLFIWSPIIFGRSFVKAGKFSIKYKSILPIKGFFISVKNFFRDLPDTLRQRKYWQKRRKINDDIFLKIK